MNDMLPNSQKPANIRNVLIQGYRKYGIIAILIIVFIVSSLVSRDFLKIQNLVNIVRQSAATMILACGMTILIISGMIDLSGGATLTLAGVMAVSVMSITHNLPLSILTGLATGACFGFVNGFMVTYLDLQPFIATLAMQNVIRGILTIYTKGGNAIMGVGVMAWFGQGYLGPIPVPIILMLVVIGIFHVILKYTKFGLYAYAVGGNANAAIASGIDVNRQKRFFFLVHGLSAGLAGIVMMGRLNSGQPSIATAGYEFDAIVAAIIGGTSFAGGIGGVIGTLVGVLIVQMINNTLVLLNVQTGYQYVVKGLLIATAVILDTKTRAIKN
jgi:inositol transport system permease protein